MKTHVASDETLQRIAVALESTTARAALVWDEATGEYTNESIAALLAARGNGLVYGVLVPKGSATACTKTGANAGIAAPVPGIVGRPAVDPYVGIGPFFFLEVNGYVDPDGTTHVTAVNGDGRFRRDGSNGDVWILAPVLWWRYDAASSDSVLISVSDSRQSGLSAQPHAYLPDGSLRPYMLYAKYALGIDADGNAASISGVPSKNRNVSHNTLITMCKTATTGYSGKSVADDWYVKVMFLLKYATKHSQSVFTGCTNYAYQYAPAVAEKGTTRVILPKASAANLLVGSRMMAGTGAVGVDRGNAAAYSVFDALKITKIVPYDDANSAVHFEASKTFDTATTGSVSTAPWGTGACDAVEGDGSPTSPTGWKEPFVIQGIETGVGLYEVVGDVILTSDGATGWNVCVCHDSAREATSVTDAYEQTGASIPTGDADGWKYPLYPDFAGGLLFATGLGASTTTGMCDGTYSNKITTSGTREWLSLGCLWNGASAGLWCVNGSGALGDAWWNVGSRLSANGRSRG